MGVEEDGAARLHAKKRELTALLKSADAFLAGTGKSEVWIENGKLVMPNAKAEELPGSAK
jgi:hypothetical protein